MQMHMQFRQWSSALVKFLFDRNVSSRYISLEIILFLFSEGRG